MLAAQHDDGPPHVNATALPRSACAPTLRNSDSSGKLRRKWQGRRGQHGETLRRGDHRCRRDRRRGRRCELARRGRRTLNLDALPAAGYGSTSASAAIIRVYYSTLRRHRARLRGLPLLAATGPSIWACRTSGELARYREMRGGRDQDRRAIASCAPVCALMAAARHPVRGLGRGAAAAASCRSTTCSASTRRAGRTIRPSATATARSPGRCCSRPAAMSTIRSSPRATCSRRRRRRAARFRFNAQGGGDPARGRPGRGRDAGRRHGDRCRRWWSMSPGRIRRWSTGWPGSRRRWRCARGRCGRRWPMCRRRPGSISARAAADLRRRRCRLLLALRHRQQAADRRHGAGLRPAGMGRCRRLEPRADRAVDGAGLPHRAAHPDPADPAAGAGRGGALRRVGRLDPDLRPLQPAAASTWRSAPAATSSRTRRSPAC